MSLARRSLGIADLRLGIVLLALGAWAIGYGTRLAASGIDTHHGGLVVSLPGAAFLMEGTTFLLARTRRHQPLGRLVLAHIVLPGALPVADMLVPDTACNILFLIATAPQLPPYPLQEVMC